MSNSKRDLERKKKRRQSLNPDNVDDTQFSRYMIGVLLCCLNKLYEIT